MNIIFLFLDLFGVTRNLDHLDKTETRNLSSRIKNMSFDIRIELRHSISAVDQYYYDVFSVFVSKQYAL